MQSPQCCSGGWSQESEQETLIKKNYIYHLLKANPQEDNGFLPKLALFTPTGYKRWWWQTEDFEMPLKFLKAENGVVKKNSKTTATASPSLNKEIKS